MVYDNKYPIWVSEWFDDFNSTEKLSLQEIQDRLLTGRSEYDIRGFLRCHSSNRFSHFIRRFGWKKTEDGKPSLYEQVVE